MEALKELKQKTREFRKGLMATTVIVDASVAVYNEWVGVVTDYVGPQLNHINGKFLDHQLRIAFVTYGSPSTRPSPILCKRYFSKLDDLKRDSVEIPELVGLGKVSDEESGKYGTAMLEAFASALEIFDLLDATPGSSSGHTLRQILHVAAYSSDNARHPAWNVNPDLDHLSWSNLPQELRKRDINYSVFLVRPLPRLERLHAAVCPRHETSLPWFEVRPHHKCLLWVPADPVENIMAVLNSTAPPQDFSAQEYQYLIEKYLALSRDNDQVVQAIRSGNQVDIDQVRRVIRTDFPLYVRLQDYFSRLRAGDLESETPFILDEPALGDIGVLSRSIDVNMEGDSEMQLASESDPEVSSMFLGTEASAFTERTPAVLNQGPFGIRFSDYPPRVISQMLSTHIDAAASSSSWHGLFTWAGFEHVSRAKKFMRVPMLGLCATGGKDLGTHTWPQNMILLPSGVRRVTDAALQEWMKRYDPVWCQFVPHHRKGGNDAVMNDLVSRQLIQQLIDRCLYAVASWDVPNCPGLWGTLLLLPTNTSGLIGAVFSSIGKPELPTPSGPNSLAGPTSLFEHPTQLDVLYTELRSFCPFSDPIQLIGRNQHHYDEVFNEVGTLESGPDSVTSSSESELGSNGWQSQAENLEDGETPERQNGSPYTQPVEPGIYPGAPGLQETFAFNFDFDGGVWVSTDPYTQLGNGHPKLQSEWPMQGLSFPESFA